MLRAFVVGLVAALLSTSFADAQTAQTRHSSVAPADQYFGRYKLSVLGIANVIKDQRTRIETDPAAAVNAFNSLLLVEDAIRDWERKYPADNWIPRDLYALELVYLRCPGQTGHDLAEHTESWLEHDYPATDYARNGRDQLAQANAGGASAANGPAVASPLRPPR